MDSKNIRVALTLAGALIFAIYLGYAAATAQTEAIIWVTATAGLCFLLGLGRNVWILIPGTSALVGGLNFIPGSPAAWQFMVLAAGSMMVMRFAMRAREYIWRWTWIDTFVLLQILAIWQSYVRNPTGMSLFGGDLVGGKPYYDFAMAFAGFALLSVIRTDLKRVRIVVICMIACGFVDSAISFATGMFPAAAWTVAKVYSGVAGGQLGAIFQGRGPIEVSFMEGRLSFMRPLAEVGMLMSCTMWRPLASLDPRHPLRLVLFVVSGLSLMLSGYRSRLLGVGLWFVVGSWLRGCRRDIGVAMVLGMLALAGLVGFGFVDRLPFAFQRILSFLPIGVSEEITKSANNSSEWRFEMWRIYLTSDKYIRNKWLGDGFAFNAEELKAAMNATFGYARYVAPDNMEYFLQTGAVHGFHAETIRFTGALGLLVATIALVGFSVKAVKLGDYFRGRPEWGLILFVCIPFITAPVVYWLIFGSYKANFFKLILQAGMLKILDNIRAMELAKARTTDVVSPAIEVGGMPAPIGEPGLARMSRGQS